MTEQSLATRAVRGTFWIVGGIAVQMVVTLVFYRVLNLEEMGYFSWAQRLVVLFPLFSALGLNDALVKHQDANDRHFSTAFWTCLLFGSALYAGLAFGGGMLGHWVASGGDDIDADAFVRVLRPMALIVPAGSISGVIRARLARDLHFRAIAISEIASVLVAALVGIGLLVMDYGVESAVWNVVVREFVLLISLWISTAWLPSLTFDWHSLRQLLGFGLNVTGTNVVNYVNNNLDKVYFVPLFLGPVATALYSFAYQYTMMPLSRASGILTRVVFPTFSKKQDDDAALQRAYVRTVGLIALGAWPVLAGGFVFAPEFLMLVKGDAMIEALNPLRLLIVAGMLKSVGTVVGSIFLAKGKAHWSFRWTVVNLAIFVPGLMWAVRYGLDGVASVVSAAALLFLIVTQLMVNRLIDLTLGVYVKTLVRPALIALFVGGILGVIHALCDFGPVRMLLLGCAVGGAVYLVSIRLFAWELVTGLWYDFRGRRQEG